MGYRGIIAKSIKMGLNDARRMQRMREREIIGELHARMYEMNLIEVSAHEEFISSISSIHKKDIAMLDWERIKSTPPPIKPEYKNYNEINALLKLNNYTPTFFDKLFKLTNRKKKKLMKKVEEAREIDKNNYEKELQEYNNKYQEWKQMNEIANNVLNGNTNTYYEVVKKFSSIESLIGKNLIRKYNINVIRKDFVECSVFTNLNIVPNIEKRLLVRGEISQKQMSKTKYYKLCSDYICGCALRVAKELLAVLPLKAVLININNQMLNLKNGLTEDMTLLSVLIPRETIFAINLLKVDPSIAMENFIHKIKFKKTKGFQPVEKINYLEFLRE